MVRFLVAVRFRAVPVRFFVDFFAVFFLAVPLRFFVDFFAVFLLVVRFLVPLFAFVDFLAVERFAVVFLRLVEVFRVAISIGSFTNEIGCLFEPGRFVSAPNEQKRLEVNLLFRKPSSSRSGCVPRALTTGSLGVLIVALKNTVKRKSLRDKTLT